MYNSISTVENSLVEIIREHKELNVFASDAVIATLMTAQSSVYPWDISVEKLSGKIILDYDMNRIFNYTTINENSSKPPEEKKKEGYINGPKMLSWEATLSNHYFSQQVLLPGNQHVLGDEPKIKIPDNKTKPRKGYIYKYFDL